MMRPDLLGRTVGAPHAPSIAVHHEIFIGQKLFLPAQMALLAFLFFVWVFGGQAFLPVLPLLVSGLDGQDGIVLEAETGPLLVRVYFPSVPGFTRSQPLQVAVASRAKAARIVQRVVGSGHRWYHHIVVRAENQDGTAPYGSLPFQDSGSPARGRWIFHYLPNLVAVFAADAFPFSAGRIQDLFQVQRPTASRSGRGGMAGGAVAVAPWVIQPVALTSARITFCVRAVVHV